ncbi:MAG: hypothetical protein ACK5LG_21935 [Bacteroides thetaiotaomicron]
MNCNSQPGSYERAQLALPVLAELEESLDRIINGVGINGVLMVARMSNPDVPSADLFRKMYCNFKQRIRDNPQFMKTVIDKVPSIMARYPGSNIVNLVGDSEFIDLLK